jgi:AraC-like DNA-binding protein
MAVAHWERDSDPRLARYVASIAFSSDDGEAPSARPIRVVPDGCVDVLFSVSAEGSRGEQPVRCEVFGTKTRALLVPPGPPVENVAIRFRPAAAARFLKTSAAALTDTSVDLTAFWGDRARILARRIARRRAPRERAAAIEQALLERLDDAGEASSLDLASEAAVRLIVSRDGCITVREVAARVALGARSLERAFRDRVGVSPKRLARILRFRAAYGALVEGKPQARVASEGGYADQAHLLREFRELAGAPPSRVLPGPSAPGRLSDSFNRR